MSDDQIQGECWVLSPSITITLYDSRHLLLHSSSIMNIEHSLLSLVVTLINTTGPGWEQVEILKVLNILHYYTCLSSVHIYYRITITRTFGKIAPVYGISGGDGADKVVNENIFQTLQLLAHDACKGEVFCLHIILCRQLLLTNEIFWWVWEYYASLFKHHSIVHTLHNAKITLIITLYHRALHTDAVKSS